MPDHYFNNLAEVLFSRYSESDRDWARMVIGELKSRFPEADHWTTGGEAINYIDIRIGKKTVGHKSGWPVFYIQQNPKITGPASFLVHESATASGQYERVDSHDIPNRVALGKWLDDIVLTDWARRRLAGAGKSPTNFPDAENTGEEQVPASEDTMPAPEPVAAPAQALNRILYGPPGTGKTYRTTREALEIIDGLLESATDFTAQKRRFDELRGQGRIAFVTFHQSFSYEDFIEGIRAEAVGGQLSYEVRDGIFKRLAINAMYQQPASPALGGARDFDTLHDAFITALESSLPYRIEDFAAGEVNIVDVNNNGTIYVTHANKTWRHGVSRATLRALYKAYPDMTAFPTHNVVAAIRGVVRHNNPAACRAVLGSLLKFEQDMKAELEEARDAVPQIDEPLEYEQIKRRVLASDFLEPNGKPYVLIIDEINRGNMSRIFGELITLIETSKRAGGPETAEVQLPYSKERFSVPDNLYVIGTMNTADRSLAVVDTALRRRFDFIEMMPDLRALAQKNVGGVDIARMLHAINLRIEQLYDREHTIGHAFFMSLADDATIDDLARIFKNKVLPLLEEYFYEDWEKINMVLGNCGIYEIQKPGNLGFTHKATTWRRNEISLKAMETYQSIYASIEAPLPTPAANSNG